MQKSVFYLEIQHFEDIAMPMIDKRPLPPTVEKDIFNQQVQRAAKKHHEQYKIPVDLFIEKDSYNDAQPLKPAEATPINHKHGLKQAISFPFIMRGLYKTISKENIYADSNANHDKTRKLSR